jgi:hypothetical protein
MRLFLSCLLVGCLCVPVLALAQDEDTGTGAEDEPTEEPGSDETPPEEPDDDDAEEESDEGEASPAEPAEAASTGPEIILTDEDQQIEKAGIGAIGQTRADLFAGLWEKGFLRGKEHKKVVLGGYAETEFHQPESENSYFDHHRLVLFVYARLNRHISFAAEIEWEHGGTPRKRDGQLDVGEVLLEFAVCDFKFAEWLGARAGVILVPFGAFNVRHDAPTRDLGVRPMAITYLIPSTWFETGAGLFGTIPLPADMELEYEAYAINGFDTKIYDGLGFRAARGSLGEDNNGNKAIVGHLAFRPVGNIEIGASAYRGAYDPESSRFVNMLGFDTTLRFGPLELLGELVVANNDTGFDEGWPEATRDPIPERMIGGYGQLNLHFFPAPLRAKLPPIMKEEATFTFSMRYGEVDTDRDAITAGDRNRLTLGFNVRPIEAFVFKNEVLLESNGASGSHVRLFSDGYDPEVRYVGSIAMMF